MIRTTPRLGAAQPPAPPSPLSSSESDADSFSLDDLDAAETIQDVLGELRAQMAKIAEASQSARAQVKNIFRRAKEEAVPWMDHPLTPKVGPAKTWMAAHDLPATPTLNAFLDAVFKAADSLDMESRVITLSRADAKALTAGQQRITIFEFLALLPTFFQ